MKLDFSNKRKTADTLEMLQVAVSALRGGHITEQGKEFLCLAVEDYIKLKQSQTGRPAKFESDKARYDFHNTKRKTERKANKEGR